MDAKLLLIGFFVVCFIAWVTKVKSLSYTEEHQTMVRNAVKQCKDWHNVAETTKKAFNASIAATRAAVYLDAVRLSVPDTDIEKITGVDISKLIVDVEKTQVEKIKTVDPSTEQSAIANVIR